MPESTYTTIILSGPPGSGKGTQAEILTVELGAEYIEAGGLMRQATKQDTDLGRTLKQVIESGSLADDATWLAVVDDKLKSLTPEQTVIFDGSPRTLEQAKLMVRQLRELGREKIVTLFLDLPAEDTVERLKIRMVCENCSHRSHAAGGAESVEARCEACGGTLVKRVDDNEATIRNRLQKYEEQTRPVLEYLQQHSDFKTIDARPEVGQVTAAIHNALGLE